MDIQHLHETACSLAVFGSREQAEEALRRLHTLGIPDEAITRVPLEPGSYPAEDGSLREEGEGVRWGALLGAPIGAAAGVGLATFVPGADTAQMARFAAGSAFGGVIVGGFVGAIVRAHFDDDVADWIHLPEGRDGVLVIVAAPAWRAPGRPVIYADEERARSALRQAGALGFLDPEAAALLVPQPQTLCHQCAGAMHPRPAESERLQPAA